MSACHIYIYPKQRTNQRLWETTKTWTKTGQKDNWETKKHSGIIWGSAVLLWQRCKQKYTYMTSLQIHIPSENELWVNWAGDRRFILYLLRVTKCIYHHIPDHWIRRAHAAWKQSDSGIMCFKLLKNTLSSQRKIQRPRWFLEYTLANQQTLVYASSKRLCYTKHSLWEHIQDKLFGIHPNQPEVSERAWTILVKSSRMLPKKITRAVLGACRLRTTVQILAKPAQKCV